MTDTEKTIKQDIQLSENGYKLVLTKHLKDNSDELKTLFVNALLINKSFNISKKVGWVEMIYQNDESKPSFSYDVSLAMPHPKVEQELAIIGISAVSEFVSYIKKTTEQPFSKEIIK